MMERARAALGTLRIKVLLAMVIVGMIPIGLVGLGIAFYYHEALVAQSSRELSGLARGVAGTLDVHLDGLLRDSQAIALLPEAGADAAEQERLLRDLFHAYPTFTRLSIYDADGARLASSSPGGLAVNDRPALREAIERGQQTWEIREAAEAGRRALVIYTPMRDAERRVVGALGTVVDLENLSIVVGRVPVGGGGSAFLLDRDQSVLLHPDQATAQRHPDYSFIGVASGGRPAGPNTIRYQVDGQWFIAGYAPVPNVGWTVIVERPEAEVVAPADQAWRLALIGLLASAALASAMAALLARRLTRPLSGLAQAAQAVGAGDLAAPLPRTADRELGTLIASFAEMRAHLAARTAEQERGEAAQRFLASASETLATSLDYEVTLNTIARLAVPFLADFCMVDTMDEAGVIRRVAAAHADPAREPLARRLLDYPPRAHGDTAIPRALRTGQPWLSEITPEYRAAIAHDDEHRQVIEALAPFYSMVVPLRARGRTLGAITFVAGESRRRYEPADLALAEDLAHRCALAMDNARLYHETQTAVKARDTFLSIASHELKTPVTIIKGLSQMTLYQQSRGQMTPERLSRLLQTMDDAANRLTGLTNDLLDVSRIQLGQMPIRPRLLDLELLTRQIAAAYEPHLSERHRLVIEDSGQPCVVMVDPDRFEQVLTNLLENAAKYSPDGGPIVLTIRREDGDAILMVHDEGIGLPPGHQESVFEPFGRAPNATSRQLPGLGLGLYICRTIIAQHGGSLTVASPGEQQGTTATIRLPLAVMAGESQPVVEGSTSGVTG